MNIVVINGTPRKYGRTRIAAKHVTEKLNGQLVDLSTMELPLFNGEEEQQDLPEVKLLKKTASEADAFVWLTPEYHNGMSGALKNCLDFLGGEHFKHKPTLLISVAGGGKGGINGLNSMRTVGRGLYANVIPTQLILDPHCFIREEDSLTEEAAEQVKRVTDDFQMYLDMVKK